MRIKLATAAKLLLSGEVVAIPTETVYGLAALYNDERAIQRIYQLKNRPPKNPLIMHVAAPEVILEYVEKVPSEFKALVDAFWPGPLTLVLPARQDLVPEIVRASLPTQAFRIPAHPIALELLKKTGPLVAPSANLSGKPSSITRGHVETDFGTDFPVLEGGTCTKGVESTILAYQEGRWVIGRLGALPAEAFHPLLGYLPQSLSKEDPLICPGQLYRHYAPNAKLKLTKTFPNKGWIIGFSDRSYPEGTNLISWGRSDHPEEVLSHLYEVLRLLDQKEIKEAYIDVDFPNKGLWRTLHERILKASLDIY